MSVWLQSLGQFFWVFVMGATNNLECYKVMGETCEAFREGFFAELLLLQIGLSCELPGHFLRLRCEASAYPDGPDQHMDHQEWVVLKGEGLCELLLPESFLLPSSKRGGG